MKKLLIALLACVLGVTSAHAQKTKAEINAEITTTLPDNTSGQITPLGLRTLTADMVNSIMPTAPVVANNTACFDGTTGLLKDCGVAPSLLIVGTTAVSSGISNGLLYNDGGILGNTTAANGALLNSNNLGIPGMTATPVLGVAGSAVGSLGFQNLTSGTVTVQAPTGALGATVVSLPGTTGTLATVANSETLTNKTINGANNTLTVLAASQLSGQTPLANGGTGQSTAQNARASGALNVDGFTGRGDAIYTILATDRVVGTNAAFTASRTWTLPAANTVNAGQVVVVADFQGTVTGVNTLIISRAGSDTVNGGTTVTISTANGGYSLWSDGISKWSAQAIGSTAVSGVSSIAGNTGPFTLANGIDNSTNQIQLTAARRTLPTTQIFTSGSSTYTTPANVLYIEIEMIGGGGGGAGSGTSPGNGGGGNPSTWGSGPILNALGGGGGVGSGGGAGVSPTGGYLNQIGNAGQAGSGVTSSNPGGDGGAGPFGGSGKGGVSGAGVGQAGQANTGGGGGGGGVNTTANGGGGGASGGYIRAQINGPLSSYSYTVGTGGAAGTLGTGGAAGGAGGSGIIIVREHYGS